MTALEAWQVRMVPRKNGPLPLKHLHDNPRVVQQLDPVVIRFGCKLTVPIRGFLLRSMFISDPQQFLTEWIEGATWNIWSGPLNSQVDSHDGLLVVPKVVVRYHPNVPTISPAASNLVATIAPQGLLNQGGGGLKL